MRGVKLSTKARDTEGGLVLRALALRGVKVSTKARDRAQQVPFTGCEVWGWG